MPEFTYNLKGDSMKILKTSDIVTIKHDGLEVDFSPLTYGKSLELASLESIEAGEPVLNMAKRTSLLIKYSVKEIRGITDYHGDAVVIKAIGGELDEDCLSDAITALSKSTVIGPISYISTACEMKEFEGVEFALNGKAVELKK
jgi:hypothetical protein